MHTPHSHVPGFTIEVKIELQFALTLLHLTSPSGEGTFCSHTDWSDNTTIGRTSAGGVIGKTLQDEAILCRLGDPFTGVLSRHQEW